MGRTIRMKRYRKIFWIFLILYFIYFLSFIPGYILTHTLDYLEEEQYRFWESLDKVFQKNKILNYFYYLVIFKIPDWTIIPMLIVNAANMALGFTQYKKKAWFYILLVLIIITSLILCDYFYIRL